MLKNNLEQLFEFIAQHIPAEQIMQAKKEYQFPPGHLISLQQFPGQKRARTRQGC